MIRVLAVHGVGPQTGTVVKADLAGVLGSAEAVAEVDALVWADWKQSPVRDGTVRGQVQDFVRAVSGAALVERRLGLGNGDARRGGTRGGRLFQVAVGGCVGLGPPAVALVLLTEFCVASLRPGYSPVALTPVRVVLAAAAAAAAPLAWGWVWAAARLHSVAPLYRSARILALLALAPLLGAGFAVMVWRWTALRNIFAGGAVTMAIGITAIFCYLALPMLILDRELLVAFFWMFAGGVAVRPAGGRGRAR